MTTNAALLLAPALWMYAFGGWLLFSFYAELEPDLARKPVVCLAFAIWPISLFAALIGGIVLQFINRRRK